VENLLSGPSPPPVLGLSLPISRVSSETGKT
jgi:hypothetical protein